MMPPTLKAVYRNGTFILETACNLSEGSEVELLIKFCGFTSYFRCRK